jgi:ABC-2 type transport system permease protein
MLWHKAWLETRGRFLAGLALSLIVGFGVIYDFRATERLLPIVRNMDPSALDTSGPLGAAIKEGLAAQQSFRGFVWWQWYRQNLTYLVVIFGALLGAGGLLAKSEGATLFTLSLPVSRSRLIGTRAFVGLAELLVLAIVPSLWVALLSPSIGQSYSVVDVLAHGLCMFVVGSVFFSLAALLSNEYADVWRPVLIACVIAAAIGMLEYVPEIGRFGIFHVMNGERYYRSAALPWIGLLLNGGIAVALLRTAAVNLARRDF